ncbi:phosphate-starvation-inducible PsiE family protein [Candidatus Nitrospira allomarina]|uniref:Phosphate-starvation-inducible PsiE family protein n=1 Tax=Candidatus Nitrospira allomarina TaxID=3020900 RepID=A0AA96G9T7_9BACT|nr:phosphate-starvation-inducible PsiE family protein [Candidatus Nitrospira allomarina]WNM58089.1 phosphate-starvation-inducible PsiE family protein [Candidatus Nitrospira allomarina]
MIQITYLSSATRAMSQGDLEDILKTARENNARLGITGMLLYGNKTFIQILEGEEGVVDELVKTIKRDPRHTNFQIVKKKPIDQHEYADWSMGFKRVSGEDFEAVKGLEDFEEKNFNTTFLGSQVSLVDSLMDHFRKERIRKIGQEELSLDEEDRFMKILHHTIRGAVKVLAVLMVFTILWGVVDVVYILYQQLVAPTFTTFTIRDIVTTFGAFMAVLIAIEIFINITLYIRKDVIHVKLVVATALMAIARKVIIFDFSKITPLYIFGTATVVLALGITYWLIDRPLPTGESENQ